MGFTDNVGFADVFGLHPSKTLQKLMLSVNWVLPATWFENHGFYGKHWFCRRFRAPSFKSIGKTNVIRELGAPSHMD